MEDLYTILKMSYPYVKVISRKAGIYLCGDNELGHSALYINNEESTRVKDFVSATLGKSWAAMMYKGGELDIIDKQDGKVVKSFSGISSLSKQNIFNDRYSTLTLRTRNDKHSKIVIIDNKKAKIIAIYEDVANKIVDTRSQYELVLYIRNSDDSITTIGLCKNMKGVILNNETECTT